MTNNLRNAALILLAAAISAVVWSWFQGRPAIIVAAIAAGYALTFVTVQCMVMDGNPSRNTGKRRIAWLVIFAACVLLIMHLGFKYWRAAELEPIGFAEWLQVAFEAPMHRTGVAAALLLLIGSCCLAIESRRVAGGVFLEAFGRLIVACALLLAVAHVFEMMFVYSAVPADGIRMASFALVVATAALALGVVGRRIWLNPKIMSLLSPEVLPPTTSGLDRNNRIWLFFFGLMVPVAASAGSILLDTVVVWGVMSLIARRFAFTGFSDSAWLAATSILYLTVMAIAVFTNSDGTTDWKILAMLVPFLAPLVLVPRFQSTAVSAGLPMLRQGAVIGLVLFGALALWQFAVTGGFARRVTAFSGNPIPAGYMVLVASLFVITGLESLPRNVVLLRLGVFAFAMATVQLTASLGVTMASAVVIVLVAIRYRTVLAKNSARIVRSPQLAVLCLVAALAATSLAVPVGKRAYGYAESVAASDSADKSINASLSRRIQMWSAAARAISDRPLTGFGIENRFDAIVPYMPASEGKKMGFSHVHNGFLTAGVAAGIPGMLATFALLLVPVLLVRRKGDTASKADWTLIASGVALVYLCIGMTGIMFFHDAIDALYGFVLTLIAAFAFGPRKTA